MPINLKILFVVLTTFIGCWIAPPAQAAFVTWDVSASSAAGYLNSTVNGSFTYNTETHTFPDFSITVFGFPGSNFALNPSNANGKLQPASTVLFLWGWVWVYPAARLNRWCGDTFRNRRPQSDLWVSPYYLLFPNRGCERDAVFHSKHWRRDNRSFGYTASPCPAGVLQRPVSSRRLRGLEVTGASSKSLSAPIGG